MKRYWVRINPNNLMQMPEESGIFVLNKPFDFFNELKYYK